jgi:hypothetical protein
LSRNKHMAGALWASLGHSEQSLDDWIESRRREGISWRVMARDLSRMTDGAISVSYQTLLNWHLARGEAA